MKGGENVSRIFEIEGNYNFVRAGEISKGLYLGMPDGMPDEVTFAGKIVAVGEGFYGFCEDSCSPAEIKKRYLYGRFFRHDDKIAVAFYRLSNNKAVSSQLFVVKEVNNGLSGFWQVRGIFDWFSPLGQAGMDICEIKHKIADELKVRNSWYNIDRTIEQNIKCLESMDYLDHALKRTLWG